MNFRYIYLGIEYPESENEKDFYSKFRNNTWILCDYLSRHVRKLKLPSDGDYNLLSSSITRGENFLEMSPSCKYLQSGVHVSDEEIQSYLSMRDERDRFEFYFSLLERGYRYAAQSHDIPVDEFLKLHQQFRDGEYRNECLFKKKMIRDYGIKVLLEHVLTQYAYHLRLTVTDLKGNYINSGYIFTTYPSAVCYGYDVRHLLVTDKTLMITDFIDKPQFECQLSDLAAGIIRSVCLDENTRKYIPNDDNKEEFVKLRWDEECNK